MNKIILSVIILTLLGVGCSVKSDSVPVVSAAPATYQIEILKSEVFKSIFTLQAKNPTSVEELMYQTGDKFASRKNIADKEVVTKLDSVLATASKVWNLYVNDKKIEFTNLNLVKVTPKDKIEWRYEAVK